MIERRELKRAALYHPPPPDPAPPHEYWLLIDGLTGKRVAAASNAVELMTKEDAILSRIGPRVLHVETVRLRRPVADVMAGVRERARLRGHEAARTRYKLQLARLSTPPQGYRVRRATPLAESTRKRRWPSAWRADLRELEDGEWRALRYGHTGSAILNALADRGLIWIAVPEKSGKPYLYRITPAGKRALAPGAGNWDR